MSAPTSMDLPERRPYGLAAAFLVALSLHALVLVAAMVYRLAPPAPPGEQQVSVDLAPVMADVQTQAPAEQQLSEAAPPETKQVEDPSEEATKPPPPAEMAQVEPDEVTPVTQPSQAALDPPPDAQPVEPQSQVVTSTAEQAEPLAPPPPVTAKAEEPKVEEAKPVEPAKPRPDPAKLKSEREAKLRKVREERRREEEREERLEEIREAKAKAARAASARAAQAKRGAEARDSAAASRRSASGRAAAGSDPSALRRWTGAISAAIHGRMNPSAAVGTGGGTALVRFTVMRSGAVSSAGLARSSGVGQIDGAALSAVRGSLPAAPHGVTQSSLSVTIPLSYRLR